MNAVSGHAPLELFLQPLLLPEAFLSPFNAAESSCLNRRQHGCASFFSVLSRANIYAAPLPWRLVLCLTPDLFTQMAAAAAAEQETAGRAFFFFMTAKL